MVAGLKLVPQPVQHADELVVRQVDSKVWHPVGSSTQPSSPALIHRTALGPPAGRNTFPQVLIVPLRNFMSGCERTISDDSTSTSDSPYHGLVLDFGGVLTTSFDGALRS